MHTPTWNTQVIKKSKSIDVKEKKTDGLAYVKIM